LGEKHIWVEGLKYQYLIHFDISVGGEFD
jgi:hypothetical protein